MRLPRSFQLASLACASLLSLTSHVQAIVDGQPIRARAGRESATILERTVRLVVRDHADSYRFVCTGFLLDNSLLVTAANCIIPAEALAEVQGRIYAEVLAGTPYAYRRPIRVFSLVSNQAKELIGATLKDPPELSSRIPIANEDCDPDSDYLVAGFGLQQGETLPAKPSWAHYRRLNPGGPEFRLSKVGGSVCAGDAGAPIFCRVKGKLALAGLVNAIHLKPKQISDATKVDEKTCRAAPEIRATQLNLAPRYQVKAP